MPALTIPLLGFSLGAVFTFSAAEEVMHSQSAPQTQAFWVVTLFGVLVFGPAAAYLLGFSPDWSYAYAVDSRRVPIILPMALALVDAASVPLGFLSASRAATARRPAVVFRMAAVPALIAVALMLLVFRRLGIYATYAQYHGDFGMETVAGSPLGYALLWMAAVVAAGVWWTVHLLRRLNAPHARR